MWPSGRLMTSDVGHSVTWGRGQSGRSRAGHDPLGPLATPWDPLQPLEPPSFDPSGPLRTPWDPLGPIATPWNPSSPQPLATPCNPLRPLRPLGNLGTPSLRNCMNSPVQHCINTLVLPVVVGKLL